MKMSIYLCVSYSNNSTASLEKWNDLGKTFNVLFQLNGSGTETETEK